MENLPDAPYGLWYRGNIDKRIAENAGAANLTLNAEDPARIDEILPNGGGFGARYQPEDTPNWV